MDGPLAPGYRRCFLKYLDSLRQNPYDVEGVGKGYQDKDPRARRAIVKALLGSTDQEIDRAHGSFHMAMFNVTAQDVIRDQVKCQTEPVPYRQCAVCGVECEAWVPKSGCLKPGYGYCGYACYQRKPPPLLALEMMIEMDLGQLFRQIEFTNTGERPKFIRQLADWVLGDTAMS